LIVRLVIVVCSTMTFEAASASIIGPKRIVTKIDKTRIGNPFKSKYNAEICIINTS